MEGVSGWFKARWETSIGLRFGCFLAMFTAIMSLSWPWAGNYYPEGNWLPGPWWLLLSQSTGDRQLGWGLSALFLGVMSTYFVKPEPATAIVSLAGVAMWIGFGAYLAMLAVV